MIVNTLIVIGSVLFMEGFAWWVHRYIMHGPGWGWHVSHHVTHDNMLEKNDLYAVVFSVIACGLFLIGGAFWQPLWFIALGFTIYGVLYGFVHDGLVHQRWPLEYFPKSRYLKRLVQAHKLHHAVQTKDGAVSFGFILPPEPKRLKAMLKQMKMERQEGLDS